VKSGLPRCSEAARSCRELYYLIEDDAKLKHLYSMDTEGNFEITPTIE
jgi:hypothetical protein